MIQLNIHNILGIVLSSPVNPNDYNAVCEALPSRTRIAVVNIVPDDTAMRIITALLGKQSDLIHYMGRYRFLGGDLAKNAECIEKLVGSRAFFVQHKKSPPTLTRVALNQWHTDRVECVLFEESLDGFYAYLRGCGIAFPEMERDILAPFQRPPLPVSTVSKFLLNASDFVAPYYTVDAPGHDVAMVEIYSTISRWIEGVIEPGELSRFKARVQEATASAMENAKALTEQTRFVNGLAICDFRPLMRRREPVSFPSWRHSVIQKHRTCILCSISPGLPDDRVCVDVRNWEKLINTDTLRLLGLDAQRTMAWVSLPRWQEFVTTWRMQHLEI